MYILCISTIWLFMEKNRLDNRKKKKRVQVIRENKPIWLHISNKGVHYTKAKCCRIQDSNYWPLKSASLYRRSLRIDRYPNSKKGRLLLLVLGGQTKSNACSRSRTIQYCGQEKRRTLHELIIFLILKAYY